jgi:hypothetical protein
MGGGGCVVMSFSFFCVCQFQTNEGKIHVTRVLDVLHVRTCVILVSFVVACPVCLILLVGIFPYHARNFVCYVSVKYHHFDRNFILNACAIKQRRCHTSDRKNDKQPTCDAERKKSLIYDVMGMDVKFVFRSF